MPELAEVEVGRKIAEAAVGGCRLLRVECAEDAIVFDGVAPKRVQTALEGARVEAVHRYGKHLWFELDRSPHPLFHFGMTGAFRIPGTRALDLESGIRDDGEWPPRFTKIRIVAEGGAELAMTNARRLGRIRLREDPLREPPLSELGFDPYWGMPRLRDFAARLGRRKIPLKALLLDQGFAAGVGNWLADEILFQARLDPRRSALSLEPDEVRRLHAKLKSIVKTAVAVDAEKDRFPKTWLFHKRWGKKAGTIRGHRIEHLTLAGRTTAWVPALQRQDVK